MTRTVYGTASAQAGQAPGVVKAMTRVSGNLARLVAGSLRREWPGRRLDCTSAGQNRVSVTMPRRTAEELYLIGLSGQPGDLGRAGARLSLLTGLPVRVVDVARQRPHVTRTDSYVATLAIGDAPVPASQDSQMEA